MLDLNNLELKYLVELRDEKEFKLYFQTKEINITDEEILQLKALLNNCKEDNKLTLQQLSNVARGIYAVYEGTKLKSITKGTLSKKIFTDASGRSRLIYEALNGNVPVHNTSNNLVEFKKSSDKTPLEIFLLSVSDSAIDQFDLIDAIHLIHAKRQLEKQGEFDQVLQDAYNALVKDHRVMFFEANFLFKINEISQSFRREDLITRAIDKEFLIITKNGTLADKLQYSFTDRLMDRLWYYNHNHDNFDIIDALHVIQIKDLLKSNGAFDENAREAYNLLAIDHMDKFLEAHFLLIKHGFNQISENIASNLADKFNQLTETAKNGNYTNKIALGMSASTLVYLVAYGIISIIDDKGSSRLG